MTGTTMTEAPAAGLTNPEQVRELLWSLAWLTWSSYHTGNVKDLLEKAFPGESFGKELDYFRSVIESPPGNGSPKC